MTCVNSRSVARPFCRLYILAVCLMSCGMTSVVFGQSTAEWTLNAPPETIQLAQVEQLGADNLRVSFTNVSKKSVLYYCVSAPEREMACGDAFLIEKVFIPGSTMTLTFSSNSFVSNGQPNRVLILRAIVYTDGSHIGEQAVLDNIEDRMLGATLETRRISDILSNISDDSVHGLEDARPKVMIGHPADASEAANQIKAISLPGISQSYVDSHLGRHAIGILEGVTAARENASWEFKDEETLAAISPSGRSHHGRSLTEDALSHGRVNVAQTYQERSKAQVNHLSLFIGAQNEH